MGWLKIVRTNRIWARANRKRTVKKSGLMLSGIHLRSWASGDSLSYICVIKIMNNLLNKYDNCLDKNRILLNFFNKVTSQLRG